MTQVMIAGYYGCGNVGDEAMLASITADLWSRAGPCKITAVSANPEHTRALHGIDAVGRLDARGLIRALRRTDLFISGGGSLIQDVTSDRNLTYQLGLLNLANMLARSVMIYGQGIGPVRSRTGWWFARNTLNRVDAITVRDAESVELLQKGGVTLPVRLAADPAFLLTHRVDPERGAAIVAEAGGAERCVGFFPRPWSDQQAEETLARAADLVQQGLGLDVVLVPMQRSSDLDCCRRIAQLMRRPGIVLERELVLGDLLDLVSALPLVVAMRLHALVFSVMAGTIPVGVSYDPKVTAFLRELGQEPATTLPGISLEQLMLGIERAWAERDTLAGRINEARAVMWRRAQISGEAAASLLKAGVR